MRGATVFRGLQSTPVLWEQFATQPSSGFLDAAKIKRETDIAGSSLDALPEGLQDPLEEPNPSGNCIRDAEQDAGRLDRLRTSTGQPDSKHPDSRATCGQSINRTAPGGAITASSSIARGGSGLTLAALKRHLGRLGSEVRRLHHGNCIICGTWGRVARQTCCSAARHFNCELDWQRRNPDKWTLVARVNAAAAAKRKLREHRLRLARAQASQQQSTVSGGCEQCARSPEAFGSASSGEAAATVSADGSATGSGETRSAGALESLPGGRPRERSGSLDVVLAARSTMRGGSQGGERGGSADASCSMSGHHGGSLDGARQQDVSSAQVDPELEAAARGWEYMQVPSSSNDKAFVAMLRAMYDRKVALFQVLPCSLCKEPWLVVPARGDFRPLLPSELEALQEKREAEALQSYEPIVDVDRDRREREERRAEEEARNSPCLTSLKSWTGIDTVNVAAWTTFAVVVLLCCPLSLLAAVVMDAQGTDVTASAGSVLTCVGIGFGAGLLLYALYRFVVAWCCVLKCRCCASCCLDAGGGDGGDGEIGRSESSRRRSRYLRELESMTVARQGGSKSQGQAASKTRSEDASGQTQAGSEQRESEALDGMGQGGVQIAGGAAAVAAPEVGPAREWEDTDTDTDGPGSPKAKGGLRIRAPGLAVDPLQEARAVAHADEFQAPRAAGGKGQSGAGESPPLKGRLGSIRIKQQRPSMFSTPQLGPAGREQVLARGDMSPGTKAAILAAGKGHGSPLAGSPVALRATSSRTLQQPLQANRPGQGGAPSRGGARLHQHEASWEMPPPMELAPAASGAAGRLPGVAQGSGSPLRATGGGGRRAVHLGSNGGSMGGASGAGVPRAPRGPRSGRAGPQHPLAGGGSMLGSRGRIWSAGDVEES